MRGPVLDEGEIRSGTGGGQPHVLQARSRVDSGAIQMKLVGRTDHARSRLWISAESWQTSSWVANPAKWVTGLLRTELSHSEIYPGIDSCMGVTGSQVEYGLHGSTSADPSRIVMQYDGATGVAWRRAETSAVRTASAGSCIVANCLPDERRNQEAGILRLPKACWEPDRTGPSRLRQEPATHDRTRSSSIRPLSRAERKPVYGDNVTSLSNGFGRQHMLHGMGVQPRLSRVIQQWSDHQANETGRAIVRYQARPVGGGDLSTYIGGSGDESIGPWPSTPPGHLPVGGHLIE